MYGFPLGFYSDCVSIQTWWQALSLHPLETDFAVADKDFSINGLRAVFQSQMLGGSEQTDLVSSVSLPSHPKTDFGKNREGCSLLFISDVHG